MKLNPKLHRQTRLQNILFSILFLSAMAMLAWLSARFTYEADWTRENRNTLSDASRRVLANLDGAIDITVFALENEVNRMRVRHLIDRYRRYKSDIGLTFINPDLSPDKAAELGVTEDGEMAIEFDGRREMLREITESALTNALQRLARSDTLWVAFLSGHGERDPLGSGHRDIRHFGDELRRKGISAQSLDLGTSPEIPANTSVLVLASPELPVPPADVRQIKHHLSRGGNLLWLAEPNSPSNLPALEESLGLRIMPGIIVDATTRLYGMDNPSFAIVSEYFPHPITKGLRSITVYPLAAAMEAARESGFDAIPFLTTSANAWTETSPIEGNIRFDAGGNERRGPLALGFALTRELARNGDKVEQRIVVLGDGDFLSNRYVGNGDNLDMGVNLIRWLGHDDRFVNVPSKTAADRTLHLSPLAMGTIGFGFLLVLPLVLFGSGVLIWRKRRTR